MEWVNGKIGWLFFRPIPIPFTTAEDGGNHTVPFLILWLILGAIFFAFLSIFSWVSDIGGRAT